MWLTLSASMISATRLVGDTCSQLVETRRPATISPNMDILEHFKSLQLAEVDSGQEEG